MITNRVGAPGWPRGFQTAPAVLSRVDANERRTKMRMFNVLPRLIKNTVKNLTHFTCNSPSVSQRESSTMSWVKSESRIVEVETGGEKEKG